MCSISYSTCKYINCWKLRKKLTYIFFLYNFFAVRDMVVFPLYPFVYVYVVLCAKKKQAALSPRMVIPFRFTTPAPWKMAPSSIHPETAISHSSSPSAGVKLFVVGMKAWLNCRWGNVPNWFARPITPTALVATRVLYHQMPP